MTFTRPSVRLGKVFMKSLTQVLGCWLYLYTKVKPKTWQYSPMVLATKLAICLRKDGHWYKQYSVVMSGYHLHAL